MRYRGRADRAVEDPKVGEPNLRDGGARNNASRNSRPNVVEAEFQDWAHHAAEDDRRRIENVHERDDPRRQLARDRVDGFESRLVARLDGTPDFNRQRQKLRLGQIIRTLVRARHRCKIDRGFETSDLPAAAKMALFCDLDVAELSRGARSSAKQTPVDYRCAAAS